MNSMILSFHVALSPDLDGGMPVADEDMLTHTEMLTEVRRILRLRHCGQHGAVLPGLEPALPEVRGPLR